MTAQLSAQATEADIDPSTNAPEDIAPEEVYEAPPKTPFWLWITSGYGVFYHAMQFLLMISPNERPIFTGAIRPEIIEGEGMSFAQKLTQSGIIVPAWFLNGIAVTAIVSVVALSLVVARRKLGLYMYTIATMTMIVLALSAGLFSIGWLLFPTLITVVATLNRDLLR